MNICELTIDFGILMCLGTMRRRNAITAVLRQVLLRSGGFKLCVCKRIYGGIFRCVLVGHEIVNYVRLCYLLYVVNMIQLQYKLLWFCTITRSWN